MLSQERFNIGQRARLPPAAHYWRALRLPMAIGVFGLCVVALLWGGLIYVDRQEHENALNQARSDTANLVIAFRENIRRTLTEIDQVMLAVKEEFAADPDHYHLPDWVTKSPFLAQITVQIGIINAGGYVRESSLGDQFNGVLNLSDRDHFRYQLDPTARQPFISPPVIGRGSGKPSIQISRRLERADGTFAGVLVVSLDPQYLSQFFETVDLGNEGVVTLLGRDGIVRARRAHGNTAIGQDLRSIPIFAHLQEADRGTLIWKAHTDGRVRIYSYAQVPGYPLIVTVGKGIDDVLADARKQRTSHVLVGIGLSFVLLALTGLLMYGSVRARRREELLRHEMQQREAAEAELRQAQKMEALGQLTGGIAHDFNNLLTVVLGNIELAEKHVQHQGALRLLQHVRRSAERGTRLIQHLLAFARKQRLQSRPTDLNQLILDVIGLLKETFCGTIRIEPELHDGLWPALADASQVEAAILNIALNARDAMPGGGRLVIQTANCSSGEPDLPSELYERDYVSITIIDNGTGMGEEVLAKVFDPFFTTKEVGKGSGLGLSQVYGLAQQSGGTVRIDSALGKGTRVRLYLRRARSPGAESQS